MTYRLVIDRGQIEDGEIALKSPQLHYLLRVVRLGNGDRFIALDGLGGAWVAEIDGKSAKIVDRLDIATELPVELSLITALPKGSGYEQIIRCCTELGASNFIPVQSDRTVLKPSGNKVQRWRKIVIEAAEQSERQIVPTIAEPTKFIRAIEQLPAIENKYICVARGELPTLGNCLRNIHLDSIAIATGCEGGWTEKEIERAILAGFKPVSLGKRILRAVTAPIVVSSLVAASCDR